MLAQYGHHIGHILLKIPPTGMFRLVKAGEKSLVEGVFAFEVLSAQFLAHLALAFQQRKRAAPHLQPYEPHDKSGFVVKGSVEIEYYGLHCRGD